jgi:hypothetical protein
MKTSQGKAGEGDQAAGQSTTAGQQPAAGTSKDAPTS